MKGSFRLGAGYYKDVESEHETFGIPNHKLTPVDGNLHVRAYEISIIVGKRLFPETLFYFNLYKNRYKYKSKIDFSNAAPLINDSEVRITGLALGLQTVIKKRKTLGVEFGVSKLEDYSSGERNLLFLLGITANGNFGR